MNKHKIMVSTVKYGPRTGEATYWLECRPEQYLEISDPAASPRLAHARVHALIAAMRRAEVDLGVRLNELMLDIDEVATCGDDLKEYGVVP